MATTRMAASAEAKLVKSLEQELSLLIELSQMDKESNVLIPVDTLASIRSLLIIFKSTAFYKEYVYPFKIYQLVDLYIWENGVNKCLWVSRCGSTNPADATNADFFKLIPKDD